MSLAIDITANPPNSRMLPLYMFYPKNSDKYN